MKTLARPIHVITNTDLEGRMVPVRFKVKNNSGKDVVINIDKAVASKEKLAGNPVMLYSCRGTMRNGIGEGEEFQLNFELKYEMNTCKWVLWKI